MKLQYRFARRRRRISTFAVSSTNGGFAKKSYSQALLNNNHNKMTDVLLVYYFTRQAVGDTANPDLSRDDSANFDLPVADCNDTASPKGTILLF